tara:strand:- start:2940 stop:4625 length:1686 start_codon:yes stop_codon:yes gene_type:complete
MKTILKTLNSIFLLFSFFILFGCAHTWYPNTATTEVRKQNLENFPYHPLVYHLDLSILAYRLYGQTLVCPFDPYYEEANNGKKNRVQFMEKVRSWATIKGAEQVKSEIGLSSYRGPGILNGFDDNRRHDPIIYRYDGIYPWSSNISNPLNSWTEYLVPKEITARITDVYMCYRKAGKSRDSVVIEKIVAEPIESAPDARDILMAFEGGTGDKGLKSQPASQSLMGFVLVRYYPDNINFDVHIVFRGSRSGSASRAALQALKDNKAKGNPDWITDLGYDLIGPESGAAFVTKSGSVSRGMTTSMATIMPTLFECLKQLEKLSDHTIPNRIYVTGHSLGGGLAQIFASALLLGDQYGPDGTGSAMSGRLRDWPWKQLKLVTYSAPRVGDESWAKKMTAEGLSSDFFSTTINPYDRNALKPTDQTILPRLTDPSKPSGFRVLLPSDPITTQKIPGGKHVGKTVYVSKPGFFKQLTQNFKAHEPANVREQLTSGLNDLRIPASAWKYSKMTDLNSFRDKSKKGTPDEYAKLASSIKKYYQDRKIHFDTLRFNSDFNLFLEIYKAD